MYTKDVKFSSLVSPEVWVCSSCWLVSPDAVYTEVGVCSSYKLVSPDAVYTEVGVCSSYWLVSPDAVYTEEGVCCSCRQLEKVRVEPKAIQGSYKK